MNLDEASENNSEEDDPLHPKQKIPLAPATDDSGTMF
jgi:hypothetical protein